jgi:hypothetical protein
MVPSCISEQQHPALQIAVIQLAIFGFFPDDRALLVSAIRVNYAWWSLAVPLLRSWVHETILARVTGHQRQQLYTKHIRTLVVGRQDTDSNSVDLGLCFPRLAKLLVCINTPSHKYKRYLLPSL